MSWINGYKIPFIKTPAQITLPPAPKLNENETRAMNDSIIKLLNQGAITECKTTLGEFISPIFLVPKPGGEFRFILNLKRLNRYIEPPHFKLEDVRSVLHIIRHSSFMATIDLRDAFYLVPIHEFSRKYLRFVWNEKKYEFICLPFGLSSAPYVFTKIMKPVVGFLRKEGNPSVIYLDDLLCFGDSHDLCSQNIRDTISCLTKLGFLINYKKSSIIPSQRVQYLGLIFDSKLFQVTISGSKMNSIKEKIIRLSKMKECTIREFAEIIGTLVSVRYAVAYGLLYTKAFEMAKSQALLHNGNNYNAWMTLPSHINEDIKWWLSKIMNCSCPIRTDHFDLTIFTDSSLTGWGASCNDMSTHGWWNHEESKFHINYLELLAIFYGLKCFAKDLRNCQILLRVDNITALSYINKLGGTKSQRLFKLAKKIWQWSEKRQIWLFASYIPSVDNIIADRESRDLNVESEWQLSHKSFRELCKQFGDPGIDLFATRINSHCSMFVSWKPDPDAYAIDAFTVPWGNMFFYAFPPFALILRTLHKISCEKAYGIMVVPKWCSQPWYPLYLSMTVSKLIEFGPDRELLLSPFRQPHPLHKKLTLVAAILSGNHSEERKYRNPQ